MIRIALSPGELLPRAGFSRDVHVFQGPGSAIGTRPAITEPRPAGSSGERFCRSAAVRTGAGASPCPRATCRGGRAPRPDPEARCIHGHPSRESPRRGDPGRFIWITVLGVGFRPLPDSTPRTWQMRVRLRLMGPLARNFPWPLAVRMHEPRHPATQLESSGCPSAPAKRSSKQSRKAARTSAFSEVFKS